MRPNCAYMHRCQEPSVYDDTRRLLRRGLGLYHHDREATIGAPAITAAVAPLELGVESVVPFDRLHQAGFLEFIRDEIAFRIHIGTDVMRDLPGRVTEAYPLVERRCTDPYRAAFLQLV